MNLTTPLRLVSMLKMSGTQLWSGKTFTFALYWNLFQINIIFNRSKLRNLRCSCIKAPAVIFKILSLWHAVSYNTTHTSTGSPDSINISVFETGSQHVLYMERSIYTTISFLANFSSPSHPFETETHISSVGTNYWESRIVFIEQSNMIKQIKEDNAVNTGTFLRLELTVVWFACQVTSYVYKALRTL